MRTERSQYQRVMKDQDVTVYEQHMRFKNCINEYKRAIGEAKDRAWHDFVRVKGNDDS